MEVLSARAENRNSIAQRISRQLGRFWLQEAENTAQRCHRRPRLAGLYTRKSYRVPLSNRTRHGEPDTVYPEAESSLPCRNEGGDVQMDSDSHSYVGEVMNCTEVALR